MDTLVIVCQLGLILMLTGWLGLGLRDNLVYPEQNRALTNMILRLDRMEEIYPDFYAQLAHRRVQSEGLRTAVFRSIVIAEAVVVAVLSFAILALLGALLDLVAAQTAQVWALGGAFGFTMIWSAFLVGGNHFAYWLCFKDQQNTHFFMTFWGLLTMIFLIAAS